VDGEVEFSEGFTDLHTKLRPCAGRQGLWSTDVGPASRSCRSSETSC
jgi:hypothetical protein